MATKAAELLIGRTLLPPDNEACRIEKTLLFGNLLMGCREWGSRQPYQTALVGLYYFLNAHELSLGVPQGPIFGPLDF